MVLGCGPTAAPGTSDATTESSGTGGMTATAAGVTEPGGTTIAVTTSPTSSATTEPTPTTTNGPSCPAFVCTPDEPTSDVCDVFLQDCPEGEKCMPVILDGDGAWNASRCVPVTGTDVPGDPCTAESTADGLDSCVEGAMCWAVDMDGNGTCVELCMGTPDAATCPNNGACTIANDGVLALCLPACSPLLQDCAEGNACYPVGDIFSCAPDASGDTGIANDPCEFINVCEAGLMCADAAFVGAGCPQGSTGCCTPFCDLTDPVPCPNPDQKCVEFYDPMSIPIDPPDAADIGVCGIPA